MKKTIMAASMLLMAATAFAQGDNYNRVGVSYTNTRYGINSEAKSMIAGEITDDYVTAAQMSSLTKFSGVSTNGFTIDYVHGWGLSKRLPMYLEAGIRFGFSSGSGTLFEESLSGYLGGNGVYSGGLGAKGSVSLRNTNFTVPVNFVWKFNVNALGQNFKVAPYTGINFRLNLSMQGKLKSALTGEFGNIDADILAETNVDTGWFNLFSKDGLYDKFVELETGEPGYVPDDEEYVAEMRALADNMTWKRFQMGWQIGVNLEWQRYTLGLEYGLDFLPAYSHKWVNETEVIVPGVGWVDVPIQMNPRVNTGTFRLTLGYTF